MCVTFLYRLARLAKIIVKLQLGCLLLAVLLILIMPYGFLKGLKSAYKKLMSQSGSSDDLLEKYEKPKGYSHEGSYTPLVNDHSMDEDASHSFNMYESGPTSSSSVRHNQSSKPEGQSPYQNSSLMHMHSHGMPPVNFPPRSTLTSESVQHYPSSVEVHKSSRIKLSDPTFTKQSCSSAIQQTSSNAEKTHHFLTYDKETGCLIKNPILPTKGKELQSSTATQNTPPINICLKRKRGNVKYQEDRKHHERDVSGNNEASLTPKQSSIFHISESKNVAPSSTQTCSVDQEVVPKYFSLSLQNLQSDKPHSVPPGFENVTHRRKSEPFHGSHAREVSQTYTAFTSQPISTAKLFQTRPMKIPGCDLDTDIGNQNVRQDDVEHMPHSSNFQHEHTVSHTAASSNINETPASTSNSATVARNMDSETLDELEAKLPPMLCKKWKQSKNDPKLFCVLFNQFDSMRNKAETAFAESVSFLEEVDHANPTSKSQIDELKSRNQKLESFVRNIVSWEDNRITVLVKSVLHTCYAINMKLNKLESDLTASNKEIVVPDDFPNVLLERMKTVETSVRRSSLIAIYNDSCKLVDENVTCVHDLQTKINNLTNPQPIDLQKLKEEINFKLCIIKSIEYFKHEPLKLKIDKCLDILQKLLKIIANHERKIKNPSEPGTYLPPTLHLMWNQVKDFFYREKIVSDYQKVHQEVTDKCLAAIGMSKEAEDFWGCLEDLHVLKERLFYQKFLLESLNLQPDDNLLNQKVSEAHTKLQESLQLLENREPLCESNEQEQFSHVATKVDKDEDMAKASEAEKSLAIKSPVMQKICVLSLDVLRIYRQVCDGQVKSSSRARHLIKEVVELQTLLEHTKYSCEADKCTSLHAQAICKETHNRLKDIMKLPDDNERLPDSLVAISSISMTAISLFAQVLEKRETLSSGQARHLEAQLLECQTRLDREEIKDSFARETRRDVLSLCNQALALLNQK